MVVDAQRGRSVALRVEVDHEDAKAVQGHRRGDVHRRGCLADAALLVGHRDDPTTARPRERLPAVAEDAHCRRGLGSDRRLVSALGDAVSRETSTAGSSAAGTRVDRGPLRPRLAEPGSRPALFHVKHRRATRLQRRRRRPTQPRRAGPRWDRGCRVTRETSSRITLAGLIHAGILRSRLQSKPRQLETSTSAGHVSLEQLTGAEEAACPDRPRRNTSASGSAGAGDPETSAAAPSRSKPSGCHVDSSAICTPAAGCRPPTTAARHRPRRWRATRRPASCRPAAPRSTRR